MNGEFYGKIYQINIVIYSIFYFFILYIFYIIMYMSGYKRNNIYEEKPMKELLITISISSLLFAIITIIFMSAYPIYIASLLHMFRTGVVFENLREDPFPEYYDDIYNYLRIVTAFLQSILFGFSMILGFYKGYKKRKKDREEIHAQSVS
ncbi:MAG: hypothetical protein FWF92_05810 [Oscillospiraceae bacterium]|nr:hypothetical protein [Oscillospiraceae bacterium]